jgi:hypothetical protein
MGDANIQNTKAHRSQSYNIDIHTPENSKIVKFYFRGEKMAKVSLLCAAVVCGAPEALAMILYHQMNPCLTSTLRYYVIPR